MPIDLEKSDFIKQVKEIILAHLNSDDSIIDLLTEKIFLSRSQLHRRIKKETGYSTAIFIRNVRLEKAKELLETTDTKISQIGYDVGFKTPQDFSKYFNMRYSMSATAFRQSLKSDSWKEEPEEGILGTFENRESITEIFEVDQKAAPEKFAYRDSKRKRNLLAASGLAALLIMTVLYLFQSRLRTPDTEPRNDFSNVTLENSSVAVLPFTLYGPDSLETFSFGLVEDILTNLSYFDGLKVISRTSSENYRDSKKSLKQIGRELDVRYLLEGSVRFNNNEFLITGQLIDSSTDLHIWAKNYRRSSTADFFDVQNDISIDIAKLMGQIISEEAKLVIQYNKQENLEARREYLIGKELISYRDRPSLESSIEYFDKALSIDPNYPAALTGKAEAYNLLASIYKGTELDHANGKIYALEAIRLNPYNGHAHAVLANAYRDETDYINAKKSYEDALQYSPNSAIINYWYSLLFRQTGDAEQAIIYSTKAKQLDPLYPVILSGHIVNCSYGGRKELAEEAIAESEQLFPNSFSTFWAKGISAECFEEYEKAIIQYKKVLEINPSLDNPVQSIIYCEGKLGKPERALAEIKKLDGDNKNDILDLAYLFAGINEMDSSLYYLDKAVDNKSLGGVIKIYPRYKSIQHTQQFQNIVAKLDSGKRIMRQ